MWSPRGFSTYGEPEQLLYLAERYARADDGALYLLVAPVPAGGSGWDEPVVVVHPDGRVATATRAMLAAEGMIVPEAAAEDRCIEVMEDGYRCGEPRVATLEANGWCGAHLPRSIAWSFEEVRVDDARGFFPAAFAHLERPAGCNVQVLLVGGFGAMRFSDGLIVDWWACPEYRLVRSHYVADSTCRCPPTVK